MGKITGPRGLWLSHTPEQIIDKYSMSNGKHFTISPKELMEKLNEI
jgi:hypothetical protein